VEGRSANRPCDGPPQGFPEDNPAFPPQKTRLMEIAPPAAAPGARSKVFSPAKYGLLLISLLRRLGFNKESLAFIFLFRGGEVFLRKGGILWMKDN
jgi:hypothetical protein